jgi:hypothetical protein
MITLRCTQKLLRRGLAESIGSEERPSTVLGDWYANLFVCRRQHLVLCMSERTLLPVLVPARDVKSLPSRFTDAACVVLHRLGVDAAVVEQERAEMQAVRIGRTANRSVLGSLNDFMFQLESGIAANPDRSLVEHALWLAQTPCKPIEYASPDRATAALFLSAATLTRVRHHAPRKSDDKAP